jgi:dihydroflavonol-4-reductase
MATIALTGATGFLGSKTADLLLAKGHKVRLLLRNKSRLHPRLANDCEVLEVDFYSAHDLAAALIGVECLFHIAAANTTQQTDRDKIIDSTLGLTKSVLLAAKNAQVPLVVYVSSVVALGRSKDPNKLLDETAVNEGFESPYVEGKLIAEQWVKSFAVTAGLDIRHVYPSWVVGAGDPYLTPPHKFISDFMLAGQKIFFDGGVSIANADCVAEGIVAAWQKGEPNGKYVLGGDNLTFKQLYDLLGTEFKKPMPSIKVPKWFLKLAATVGKAVLGTAFPISPKYVESVIGRYSWYNSSKAKNLLGYEITPAKQTIALAKPELLARQNGTYWMKANKGQWPTNSHENKKAIFVTGFPGWLGNRFVDTCIYGNEDGDYRFDGEIRLLVRGESTPLPLLPSNCKVIYGDVTKPETYKAALAGCETVFHFAGLLHGESPAALYKVNTNGTKMMIDSAIEQKVAKFIFISTDSVGGFTKPGESFSPQLKDRPYKHYGQSKAMAEAYLKEKVSKGEIAGVSLRSFWFFGPNPASRNLSFFKMFSWPFQLVFGNGKNVRAISHVDDLIQAFWKAEASGKLQGGHYYIPSLESSYTVDGLFQALSDGMGHKANRVHIPKFLCRVFEYTETMLSKLGIQNQTLLAAGKFDRDITSTSNEANLAFGYKPKVQMRQIVGEIKTALENS